MNSEFVFTSESVTDGHPDKLCDQIADAILGRYLRQDRMASVIAEAAISTGIVFVAARVGSDANIDIPHTARDVIRRAGYDQSGFDVKNCTVMTSITDLPLSSGPEETELDDDQIHQMAVADQAVVFGFACDQTPSLMPLPIWLSHQLARRISQVRQARILPFLAPDAKTQVGIEFQQRQPSRVHSISIIASQKERGTPSMDQFKESLIEHVIRPTFDGQELAPDKNTLVFINPGGPVIVGGPAVHSGMTGRKTAVDTYGEFSRCSASALSGKDPTRIDRVGAYAARYAAKNVVAAGLARECEIQLSYCIGLPGPVSVQAETYGSSIHSDAEIARIVEQHFDFRLAAIIRKFQLRDLPARDEHGFYERLSAYGHVGRMDIALPWEVTDRAEILRAAN